MALFNPCMKFKNSLGQKTSFEALIKRMAFTKNIINMSQGPPNPGFRSVEGENRNCFKNDMQDFKNSFQFWFL